MDVNRLICEVQKRPALWDLKHGESKSRYSVPTLWKEVASAVGFDVDQCKRKWKNLRDAYRAEVRRCERRIERDKLIGEYDPNTNYASKWVHFEPLNFINDCKRPRYTVDYEGNPSSNDEVYDQEFHSVCNIKTEPPHIREEETAAHHVHFANETNDAGDDEEDDDDERANDILFEEFQNIVTPQAARRLSSTLSVTNSLEHNHSNDTTTDKPPFTNADNECKCSKRTEERVHFLEGLEQEEQKLMQSTTQDIKRALDHVGDSDYNFLVSFLPQMKKMSDLQNLQFRARMCDLVLNILAPTISNHNSPIPPPLTPAPAITHVNLRDKAVPAIQQLPAESSEQQSNHECLEYNGCQYSEDSSINAATSTSSINTP